MRVNAITQRLSAKSATHVDPILKMFRLPDLESALIGVAYVSQAGVSQIEDALFTVAGKVTAFVGINNGATTWQGLQTLLRTGVHVNAVDTNSVGMTFHPKAFICRSASEMRVLVGSANLTASGLGRNFELGILLKLALTKDSDRQLASQLAASLVDPLRRMPQEHPKLVLTIRSEGDIQRLIDEGRLEDEHDMKYSDSGRVQQGSDVPSQHDIEPIVEDLYDVGLIRAPFTLMNDDKRRIPKQSSTQGRRTLSLGSYSWDGVEGGGEIEIEGPANSLDRVPRPNAKEQALFDDRYDRVRIQLIRKAFAAEIDPARVPLWFYLTKDTKTGRGEYASHAVIFGQWEVLARPRPPKPGKLKSEAAWRWDIYDTKQKKIVGGAPFPTPEAADEWQETVASKLRELATDANARRRAKLA